MRVMHVMAGADHGGAETFFLDLVCALQADGLDQVAVTRPEPHRVARLRDAGVKVVPASFSRLLPFRTRGAIRDAFRAHRPEVVQAWMGRANSFTPRLPVPVIGWFGGYYDLKRYGSADHYVGVTRDLGRHIREAGAPADKVHVIHTFALLDDGPPVPRAEFDTPEGAPLILALARLHRKKGIDVLLKALVQVPEAYLWIAGEGELRGEIERMIVDLGLSARVRMLGWRTDRGALLRTADLCAFPSRYEPFGTVMVEAWVTGTPIVAAAAAGPAAYMQDGDNGLLVPIDDVDALAGAIRRCLSDPELCRRLVAGGTRTYQEVFTQERIVAAYRDLYRQAAAQYAAAAA